MRLRTKTTQALLVLILGLIPLKGTAETLTDALQSAYQNSGLLQQNRALLHAANEDLVQAVAAMRPILDWAISRQYNLRGGSNSHTDQTELSANWQVYGFGRARLRRDALKETVLSTRQKLIAVEQNVLLQTVQAYMNLRRATETEGLRKANVGLIEQELRAARDRFEVGEVTRTDVALAEARLAAARAQLAAASGDRIRQTAAFEQIVGRPPGPLSAPPDVPNIPKDVDTALGQAQRGHPDLLDVQHQIAAAELYVKAERRFILSTVSLSAKRTLTETDESSRTSSAAITFSGPIYQGGAMSSKVRAAMARRNAARGQLHNTKGLIEQGVKNGYVLLDVAQASAVASERQVQAATVAFRGVREEAALGARTTLDVLNAEQELLDARASRISAAADEQIAAYTILAAMGQLTVQSLNLDVKTYDPEQYYGLAKSAPISISGKGRALRRALESMNQ